MQDVIDYIQSLLFIRNKRGSVIPFMLNEMQWIYLLKKYKALRAGKAAKFLVLKYRRGGITTLEQAFNFCAAIRANQEVVTLAHDRDSTQKIFRIAKLFYDKLPNLPSLKPPILAENKNELNFNVLNSLFYIGTAGSKRFGRGQTLQRAHGSEVAFWNGNVEEIDSLIAGLTEATSEGEVVLESTANGIGNWFSQTWTEARKGGNDWTPIFLAWFVDPTNIIPLEKNEVIEYTEEEAKLYKKNKLFITPEKIKWRRWKKKNLKLFIQEYPEDDITAFIVSGNLFFDAEIIRAMIDDCFNPIETRDNGCLRIWEKPLPNRRYIIGADTGEGLATSDYSCGSVIDKESCRQVATLHGRWKPEMFGLKLANLGLLYNKALIAVEANNHGHSTLNTLSNQLHYAPLYWHVDYDSKNVAKLGWQTNGKTRPIMLDNLDLQLTEGTFIVNDRIFLDECLTFKDDGTGKYQAASGYHDDLVMSNAIALQVRLRKSVVPKVS